MVLPFVSVCAVVVVCCVIGNQGRTWSRMKELKTKRQESKTNSPHSRFFAKGPSKGYKLDVETVGDNRPEGEALPELLPPPPPPDALILAKRSSPITDLDRTMLL